MTVHITMIGPTKDRDSIELMENLIDTVAQYINYKIHHALITLLKEKDIYTSQKKMTVVTVVMLNMVVVFLDQIG